MRLCKLIIKKKTITTTTTTTTTTKNGERDRKCGMTRNNSKIFKIFFR